jgi:thiazole synthase
LCLARGLCYLKAMQASPAPAASADELSDPLVIAGRSYGSRLLVGTGKYKDFDEMNQAIAASGAEIVTVALRRVETSPGKPNLLSALDRRYVLLPNTAGCYTADEAVRTCRLARELGCAAVMPLGAPIGSGLGIRNPYNLRIILETVKVPVIVDAGVGTASDAAIALELGCHGVLMNTGIAAATNPVQMAHAMRLAVDAGRRAFRAGRMPKRLYANASSPESGLIE